MAQPNKLKILFLAAEPKNEPRLQLSDEFRLINESLSRSQYRDSFDFCDPGLALREEDLQQLLSDNEPSIVHFAGHCDQLGQLLLTDNKGNANPVPQEALVRWLHFHKATIRCVVLNACYTEPLARAIAQSIDFVVGTPAALGDDKAVQFAEAFYFGLGSNDEVQTALDKGCTRIHADSLAEENRPKLVALRQNAASERPLQWLHSEAIIPKNADELSEADPFRLLTQQCKDGIAELRKLTGKKPKALGFVCSHSNQIVFRRCCTEIGALHILKELHLKFDHLERVIRSLHEQSTSLSKTHRAWSDVTEAVSNDSEMGLKNTIAQIDRLLDNAHAQYKVPDAISWRDSLGEAHNKLKSAADSVPLQTDDEVRTKTIKNAFDAFLRDLFSDPCIPREISSAMANRVASAHLGDLSVILHKIYLDLTDNNLVTDDQRVKIAACEEALIKLNKKLDTLILCHSSLQSLDLELRPFLSTREYQLMEASWPKITKPANMVWKNCQNEEWRTDLGKTILGQTSFVSTWTTGQIETDLHRFQDSFTDLDKRLMKLCDAFYEGVFKPITDMMPTIMGG